MTGYAVVTRETGAGTLTVELKSVNSRFLDLQFRINDELRSVEPAIREAIMARITRGKVECRLSFGRKSAAVANPQLNLAVIEALSEMQRKVKQTLPDAAALSVNEILRWPGVIEDSDLAQEALSGEVQAAVADALDAFIATREREGAALQAMLLARVEEMEGIVHRITPLVPQAISQFQQKATERMKEALGLALQSANGNAPTTSRDEALERIRQEVTLYGIRIDVAEELSRLSAHLAETRHILKKGGQVGKRLDFMMQELNREANTVGSKAALKELSDASMAMKLLIEQMREQVQNLE
nr:YicC/YloC family endoribonuclease [Noviherbaspirillum aridicola]